MIGLLRTVSLRDYRAAPGRLALMIGGIASGVALVSALGIINHSVLANFRATLEQAAGKAALQVGLGTGEVGFDEGVVGLVAADPGVEHAFGLVRGTLAAADRPGEALQLFGIDVTSDAIDSYGVRVVDREGDEIELLNDPTSVFLTEEYARERRIGVGDRVPFATPSGVVPLHVRGLLHAEGLATVFGGNLAVMDLAAAQRLLHKERLVDQVDVVLKEGESPPRTQARLTRRLPSSLSVEPPALRGAHFERVIGAFQAMLDALSLLCLLAGVFIVYNTAATAITQRARDLAILIALGADRRTVFALVLVEAVILGVIASLIGTAFGLGLAHVLLQLVSQSMGVVYQARFHVQRFEVLPGQVAWYTALGAASAVAAALVPAYKASRLDPLDLMRPDFRERLAITSPNRLLLGLWAVTLALTTGAVHVATARRSVTWGNFAAVLWWVSIFLLSIPLMTGISTVLRRVLPRLFGVEGRVAVEGLRRSPGRTGVTTAVIALSLTLAVALASIALSFRESERNWFILAGDLVVSAVGTEGGWLETPLGVEVGDVLRRIPGVAHVETYRALQGQPYRDARIAIVALSPGFLDTEQFRRQLSGAAPDDAVRAVAQGDVIVSDNLVDRFGLRVGDTLTLPAPGGPESFHVAGILAGDYSGDQGSVILGRDRFASVWHDPAVSHFNLFVRPSADRAAVRRAVTDALGGRYVVKILTVPETLAYHQGMVDRAFVFTYAIQLLVVVVTLGGIFDLLTTQIVERQREIGTFVAVGADAGQIARTIRLEALVIGISGALLGCTLGVGTSRLWVHVNFRILLGYILDHHFAVLTAVSCVGLAAGMALIAAELAARRALRAPVLDILRYE
jgi:putative ABC transport system permease protein